MNFDKYEKAIDGFFSVILMSNKLISSVYNLNENLSNKPMLMVKYISLNEFNNYLKNTESFETKRFKKMYCSLITSFTLECIYEHSHIIFIIIFGNNIKEFEINLKKFPCNSGGRKTFRLWLNLDGNNAKFIKDVESYLYPTPKPVKRN